MAISIVNISSPSGLYKYRNTDVNATKDAIDATSGVLHALVLDNTANAAITYVKLWDAASAGVTVGTTAPDWVFKVPASAKRTIVFHDGVAYANALVIAAVTGAGTAGVTPPTSAVVVEANIET